jgi:hypothetical protein
LQDLLHRDDYVLGVRRERLLERVARRRRRVGSRHARDGRFEEPERFLCGQRGDFGANAAKAACFVHDDEAPGFAHRRV